MTIQQIDTGMVAYQVLDEKGNLVGSLPSLSTELMLKLYRTMHLGRALSNKIIALQRQGRATTFGPLNGQEAATIGLAAPMQPQDWLSTSYREMASLVWRGVPIPSLIYSYRGLPAQYPPETRCLPVQIVIGTQMLHAVGLGMAAKIAGDPVVSVGVCGDGATSEGDFNEALNFAGVFKAPVVLVVQNNGWAISVPRHRQSAAPTLGPTLIELLTYRLGPHTTSDDPTRYRDEAEVAAWREKDPITRFQRFLLSRDLLNQEQDRQLVDEVEDEVNRAANEALETPAPAPDVIFDFVQAEPSARLQAQRQDLLRYAGQDSEGRR